MTYWKINVDYGKDIKHDVYYSTKINLSLGNIARNAVLDKYMIGVQLPFIKNIEEISREEYCKFMWE